MLNEVVIVVHNTFTKANASEATLITVFLGVLYQMLQKCYNHGEIRNIMCCNLILTKRRI